MSDLAGSRERTLARAKRYPYAAPARSFVLVGGREYALPEGEGGRLGLDHARARDPATGRELPLRDLGASDLDDDSLAARIPVLAYGANRSPEALERKRAMPGFPPDSAILVVRARLHGLDVVYSAHLSPYGSVGATLQRSPGTVADAAVILLTQPQLTALGGTEPNYTLEELSEVDVELEGGERLARVRSYVSRHGCLAIAGHQVALAEIAATGRRLEVLTQPEALAAVAVRLGHRGELDEFILENVADQDLSAERTRELRCDSRPLAL